MVAWVRWVMADADAHGVLTSVLPGT